MQINYIKHKFSTKNKTSIKYVIVSFNNNKSYFIEYYKLLRNAYRLIIDV